MKRDVDDQVVARQIELAAKAREEDLLNGLRTRRFGNLCYAYKTRVKPAESLLEKVARKAREKPGYDLFSIRDVLGLRVVVIFRQDMEKTLKGLLQYISNADVATPFVQGKIEEAIIYSVNRKIDRSTPSLSRIIRESGIVQTSAVSEKVSAEGYSSVHIVAFIKGESPFTSLDWHVPVEIQIRTVFEDAWGEIQHKYFYDSASSKKSAIRFSTPRFQQLIQENLRVFKSYSDACGDYADLIHASVQAQVYDPNPIVFSQPSDPECEAIAALQEYGATESTIRDFLNARLLIKEGHALKLSKKLAAASLAYHHATELLDRAWANEQLGSTTSMPEKKLASIQYYLQMDAAFCTMAAGELSDLWDALGRYKTLSIEFPNDPLIAFRCGQAFADLGRPDESIDRLKIALELLSGVSSLDSITGLTSADTIYLKSRIPILLGEQLLECSERNMDQKKRLDQIVLGIQSLAIGIGDSNSISDDVGNEALILIFSIASNCLDELQAEPKNDNSSVCGSIVATLHELISSSFSYDNEPLRLVVERGRAAVAIGDYLAGSTLLATAQGRYWNEKLADDESEKVARAIRKLCASIERMKALHT